METCWIELPSEASRKILVNIKSIDMVEDLGDMRTAIYVRGADPVFLDMPYDRVIALIRFASSEYCQTYEDENGKRHMQTKQNARGTR